MQTVLLDCYCFHISASDFIIPFVVVGCDGRLQHAQRKSFFYLPVVKKKASRCQREEQNRGLQLYVLTLLGFFLSYHVYIDI
jgi:hypothetical protein